MSRFTFFLLLIFTAAVVTSSAGCGEKRRSSAAAEDTRILRTRALPVLDKGMSPEEVKAKIGNPLMERTASRDKKSVTVLFYDDFKADGQIRRPWYGPVVFIDGRLVGWGHDAYEKKCSGLFDGVDAKEPERLKEDTGSQVSYPASGM